MLIQQGFEETLCEWVSGPRRPVFTDQLSKAKEFGEFGELPSTLGAGCSTLPLPVCTAQLHRARPRLSAGMAANWLHKLRVETHLKLVTSSPLATSSSPIMGVKTLRCC